MDSDFIKDFDFEAGDEIFREKRRIWDDKNRLKRQNQYIAFNRTIKPMIFDRLRVILSPSYVVSKENPWPPQLRHIETKAGDFTGWDIGHGLIDGFGGTNMLLTIDGKLPSYRERWIRRTQFIGYVIEHDLSEPVCDDYKTRFKASGIEQAYINLYSFAKEIGIPEEEIEAVRKAVGPPTSEEKELLIAAEENTTE